MFVIFSASSDGASYQHSSRFFEPMLRWLFPQMSQAHVETIHLVFRKCCHLTEFAILALLFWRAIHQSQINKYGPRGWIWAEAGLALASVQLYAASDEIHQIFIPGRTGQISDVFVDVSGGALGLALLWLVGKKFKRW